MADSKISALTALTGAASATGDEVPVVDVSDTTMSATGTTKAMTMGELAKGIGLDGRLVLDGTTPTNPTTGVAMFEQVFAKRGFPSFIGPLGTASAVQPFIGRNQVQHYRPHPGQTDLTGVGMTLTATGTVAALAPSIGGIGLQSTAINTTATSSSSAVAGYRVATAAAGLTMWRGNQAGLGGFTFICRWRNTQAWPSTQRAFIGLSNQTAAPTDVNPSSFTTTPMIGLCLDSTDTIWQFIYNDSASPLTKVSTGFSEPTADNALHELIIYAKPFDDYMYWQFNIPDFGLSTEWQTATDLPSNTTFMSPRIWRSVGGTNSTIGVGLVSLYCEQDY